MQAASPGRALRTAVNLLRHVTFRGVGDYMATNSTRNTVGDLLGGAILTGIADTGHTSPVCRPELAVSARFAQHHFRICGAYAYMRDAHTRIWSSRRLTVAVDRGVAAMAAEHISISRLSPVAYSLGTGYRGTRSICRVRTLCSTAGTWASTQEGKG